MFTIFKIIFITYFIYFLTVPYTQNNIEEKNCPSEREV